MEKEKFRQLIEQGDNYRAIKNQSSTASSITQRNVCKHFIQTPSSHASRDGYNSDSDRTLHLTTPNSAQGRVSCGYSRRISLSLDTKPESIIKATAAYNGASYFNKYSMNGVLKNASNSNKYQSNSAQVIDVIDITNGSSTVRTKSAQKRPGLPMNENDDIENFRKV